MISKSEYQEWRMSKATQELLDLLKVGQEQSVEELLGARGETGDFQRGACLAFGEVIEIIRVGEGLYEKE